ncbi:MAG: ribosome maturation factor RimP [Christensenellales bacterium]
MPGQSMSVSEARRIAQKLADDMGYALVDVELVKEPAGRFLRFFVEKGEGVTLDELEVYHRKIQPLVERVDFDYMEVSSPGADRPLKTERDFARAAGMRVEVRTYRPIGGAKRFVGDLIALADGVIRLATDAGEFEIPKRDAAIVRPLIEFDESELADDAPNAHKQEDE